MKCLVTTLEESVTIKNPVFFDVAEVYVYQETTSDKFLIYKIEDGKTVVAKDKDGTIVKTLKGNGSEQYIGLSSGLVGKTLYFTRLSDIIKLSGPIISVNIEMYKNKITETIIRQDYSFGNIETLTKLTSLTTLTTGYGLTDHVLSGSLNVLAKGQVDNGRESGVLDVWTQSSQNLTYNGSKISGHYRILFGTSMESPTETDTANGYQVQNAN